MMCCASLIEERRDRAFFFVKSEIDSCFVMIEIIPKPVKYVSHESIYKMQVHMTFMAHGHV